MIKNISSLDILQEKVNSKFILENVFHGEDEWVLGLEQDIFLRFGINDLTLLNENIFVDSLHSKLAASLLVHNQEYLTKRSLINDFLDLEIFQFDFAIIFSRQILIILHTHVIQNFGSFGCFHGFFLVYYFLFVLINLLNFFVLVIDHIIINNDKIEEVINLLIKTLNIICTHK